MLFGSKRKKQSPYTVYKHVHEISALLLFITTLFLCIACLTYSPLDRSWFYYATEYQALHNWCGVGGAYSAAALFYCLGSFTYAYLILLFVITYYVARKKSIQSDWERFVASILFLSVCAALVYKSGHTIVQGGALGLYLFNLCHYFFDAVGTILLLYTLAVASFFVMTRLSIVTIFISGQRIYYGMRVLMKKYKVVQRCVNAITLLAYGLYRLSHAWYAALKSLIDGSLFYDAGYTTPAMHTPAVDSFHNPPLAHESKDIVHDASPKEAVKHDESEPLLEYSAAQRAYMLPQSSLFVETGVDGDDSGVRHDLEHTAKILEEKLKRFGVSGSVISIKRGPVVTLFEYQPSIDTKLSKIVALEDDLALALQALSIRILAPIPGRSVVGFEVANKQRKDVSLADIIRSTEFQNSSLSLPLVLGQNTTGAQVIVDLVKMPHLLIAGSTGSGKSVALNTMLMSLLCKCAPDELRLILIDPKRLEFASYVDIAHLLFPIVTDPRKAAPILRWVVHQMEQRYEKMAQKGVRNMSDYNKHVPAAERLPFIVVIIDELADLMMTAGRDIEDLIARITQMARAAGIHMIVATQRPSVDVITGLIKVNFPSRISFRVTSKVDSRTILDCNGADKLLGRGDMLFLDSHQSILRRVHGAYVSDKEIEEVVSHIKMQQKVEYLDIMEELSTIAHDVEGVDDDIFDEVVSFLQETDDVSISLLQRKFKIGYNRSARIIERLESQGMIMPAEGGKTRKVIR